MTETEDAEDPTFDYFGEMIYVPRTLLDLVMNAGNVMQDHGHQTGCYLSYQQSAAEIGMISKETPGFCTCVFNILHTAAAAIHTHIESHEADEEDDSTTDSLAGAATANGTNLTLI